MGSVWAIFRSYRPSTGDVTIPTTRADDPDEWIQAREKALRNAEACVDGVVYWQKTAGELLAGALERRAKDGD